MVFSASEHCIQKLFEQQAARTPERIALIVDDCELTYRALNAHANRLASDLISRCVKPGTRIGVLASRTPAAAIGILGVLKAGGVYVPLDAQYPKRRLSFMIADAGIELIVADQQVPVSEIAPAILVLQLSAKTSENDVPDPGNPAGCVLPSAPGFIVYTSGSTGEPKGVITSHKAFCTYIESLRSALCVVRSDRFLHTASIAFSSSNRQLFLPLCSGSTVVMATAESIRDPIRLFGLIKSRRVTIIDLVPSFWRVCIELLSQLAPEARNSLLQNDLRTVLSASEPLPYRIPLDWRAKLNQAAPWINMYGMTETTGIVSIYKIPGNGNEHGAESGLVPIGVPINEVECHLFSDEMTPVTGTGEGHLYISGATLAQNYVNNPDLTNANFISKSLSGSGELTRLYKTGDICRRRTDGTLEYVGRSDHQLKINGVRIQPEEIERVIEKHPAIRETAVVTVEIDGNQQLVAFFVATDAVPRPCASDLRQFTAEYLPDYMIPTHFLFLQEIPRLPNRKIDRQALVFAARGELDRENASVSPSLPPTASNLRKIWGDVLGRQNIGIDDGFYQLGGNSLLGIRVLSRILDEYGISLSAGIFMETSTVRAMAAYIDALENQDDPKTSRQLQNIGKTRTTAQ